ncbi:serine hydrolase [Flavobacterium sp. N1736]|uniref:serine hydrolase n=1 Tax=Flavobacterium sp. N1736 TaxID=2986823 RepID=UPI002224D0C5|nr:serine hydrolase [Flavobacterium sp. N1736]
MKKLILIVFISLSFSCLAQKKLNHLSETEIVASMDKNAEILLENSKANSVSIGIVKDGKTYTKHYGEIDKGKGNQANNNTVFEIASITKLFTGLLMAQAVVERKISPDDDIRKYITGSYPNLEYQGNPIKIKDLVSFKTGFNKDLPDNSEFRKNPNDSSYIGFKKLDESYSREKFFADLKTIKLNTLPGTKFKYSNGSVQLAAHILENVFHKSYETLLKENILSKLNMTSTTLNPEKSIVIANGYNGKKQMPTLSDNLWGAAGYLKSTLGDLTKFLAFEINTNNKVVLESQRNLLNSDSDFNGYFWDGIQVDNNGKNCWKHGGAFGAQNMFLVYPERGLGISIIVNISNEKTANALGNAIVAISGDLLAKNEVKKEIYGYKITNNNVIFTYQHDKSLDAGLVKSVAIAGSFDNWNPNDKNYQMVRINKNTFELSVPKSQFEKDKINMFKFVINKTGWVKSPKGALNMENGPDQNLLLKID